MKFRKVTISGIVIGLIIYVGLYLLIGIEGLIKHSNYILIIVMVSQLILLVFYLSVSKKISWLIEPVEDDEKLLNLLMNRSLSNSTLLLGSSLAFIIPGVLIIPPTSTSIFILILGLFLYLSGHIIYSTEYLPRNRKLEIKYKISKK